MRPAERSLPVLGWRSSRAALSAFIAATGAPAWGQSGTPDIPMPPPPAGYQEVPNGQVPPTQPRYPLQQPQQQIIVPLNQGSTAPQQPQTYPYQQPQQPPQIYQVPPQQQPPQVYPVQPQQQPPQIYQVQPQQQPPQVYPTQPQPYGQQPPPQVYPVQQQPPPQVYPAQPQQPPVIVPVQPQEPQIVVPPANDVPTEPPPFAVVPPPGTPPVGVLIDGHVRSGAFLSGPGSLAFIIHHTLMPAVAGFAIEGISNKWDTSVGARTAILAGTLIGAGLGFGASAWWQFNHWIGESAATYGAVDSLVSGMFLLGLVGGATTDDLSRAVAAFLGAELGAWVTVAAGGGDLPQNKGLMIASGAGWGLIYGLLLLATIITTNNAVSTEGVKGFILLSPGIGAGALALAALRFNPSSAQVLRADVFGAGVGGAVLLLSALVLGFRFDLAVPYVLAMLTSAGAITAVSLLWEERAERPALYHDPTRDQPYRTVWW
jgi:hypothetical protein